MIDLQINENQLEHNVQLAKERKIVIPTFHQLANPDQIPKKIVNGLKNVGLQEQNPLNLFRITWKNEPKEQGGLFGDVNFWEVPSSITGISAKIVVLIGKWFPTGAHKVGATYGCLVPRLVSGQFDATTQKAVWPSTGNFCRGGAYNSKLLGCESIAILPEEMSAERFEWLKTVADEVIATPGCESNVKEIYDKCHELRRTRGDKIMIFNQFEEFGNYLWHYTVTGQALEEVFVKNYEANHRLKGLVSSTGSAGTIACGDYLKEKYPLCKIGAAEALQCPTMLLNGYGGHRIEGIGDKHIPWIHNTRNTDMVIAMDDEFCIHLLRLFNEENGRKHLSEKGVDLSDLEKLSSVGISGIGNILSAIKMAKYYEMNEKDVVFTICTDSVALYGSRLEELNQKNGSYTKDNAIGDYERYLRGVTTDHLQELSHYDRKRIHHLKYFTWIEQQGASLEELNSQWQNYPDYWSNIRNQVSKIDELIYEFNKRTGLIAS